LADFSTIDFEGLSDLTPVTTQDPGVTFSNTTVLTAGKSLNEFEFPPISGSNAIFDDGGAMSITFASGAAAFSGSFTYSVQLTLTAYDRLNNPIAIVHSAFSNNEALSGVAGSHPNELISVAFASGISRITVVGDPRGSSFVLDDVSVTLPTGPKVRRGQITSF
jgi:hypothetical protein